MHYVTEEAGRGYKEVIDDIIIFDYLYIEKPRYKLSLYINERTHSISGRQES